MTKNHILTLLVIFFWIKMIQGQELQKEFFNDYKVLVSKGAPPSDFTVEAYKKTYDDLRNKKAKIIWGQKYPFLQYIHLHINKLLHSGQVVYGDDVSLYLNKIANKLLLNQPELRNKLRFYTIKSNEVNAFSTFQGIIFVTTGLLSKLDNEAELAFVLSHEITHFTHNHLVESYNYTLQKSYSKDVIQLLSNYSKNHEFEADKVAVKLYHDAAYSMRDIPHVFDMLLTSHTPFEELEINEKYFFEQGINIPSYYFPKEKYKIILDEEYNDSLSSHPNIKKRKEALAKEVLKYTNWNSESKNDVDLEFNKIRTICRFECLRRFNIETEYDDALYQIYLLEQEFPNSIYLSQMKAKAWLGLAQSINLDQIIPEFNALEGEIASLQYCLRKLNKIQINSFALKIINDLNQKHPGDQFLEIAKLKIMQIMVNYDFDFKPFYVASKIIPPKSNLDLIVSAENNILLNPDDINLKIKNLSKQKDTINFHYLILNNLIQDSVFLNKYAFFKNKSLEKYNRNLDLSTKNSSNNPLKIKNLGINELFVIEPTVDFYANQIYQLAHSEGLAKRLNEGILELSKSLQMKILSVSYTSIESVGTIGFNQKSIFNDYLLETEKLKEDVLPCDFQAIQEFKENNKCNHLMFLNFKNEVEPKKHRKCSLDFTVINLSDFEIVEKKCSYFTGSINKHAMTKRIFEIMRLLNMKAK